MTFIKKKIFVLIVCVLSGVLIAISFNNNFLHLSYRLHVSQIIFFLLIILFVFLVYIGAYKFTWLKRLNNFSIKDKWLLLYLCIAFGVLLFIPPLTKKVPVNLSISTSEHAMPPSHSNEVGVIEIKIEGGKVPFDWLKQSGEWETKYWLGTPGLFSSGQQVSTLSYVYETSRDEIEVEILFAENQTTGTVYVQIEEELQSFNTQGLDDGTRLVIFNTSKPPQFSWRWITFVFLSYLSDITLVGLLIFMIAAWSFTSPVLLKKCRLLWQKLLLIGKVPRNKIIKYEVDKKKSDEHPTICKHSSVWKYLPALLFIVAVVSAIIWLQIGQTTFKSMLFDGGTNVFLTNLSLLILYPALILFLLSIGSLIFTTTTSSDSDFYQDSIDIELNSFFTGAGVVIILGFVMGMWNLLVPWVTIPIFLFFLLLYLRGPVFNIWQRFWFWVTAKDTIIGEDTASFNILRLFSAFIRITSIIIMIHYLLVFGLIPELMRGDVNQLYFSYFAEVRNNHSIWVDQSLPRIYDFLVNRGNGIHLFFTSFTNQYAIQLIGIMFLSSIAFISRQIVNFVISKFGKSHLWQIAKSTIPDLVMLLVFSTWEYVFLLETGKIHPQTAALLLFLLFGSLQFLFLDKKQGKLLLLMLLPVAIALPISHPIYGIFGLFILTLGMFIVTLGQGKILINYFSYLILLLIIAGIFSALVNQIHVGIIDNSALSLFENFINIDRFQKYSSIEMVRYVQLTQDYSLSLIKSFDMREIIESLIYSFSIPIKPTSVIYPVMIYISIASLCMFRQSQNKYFPMYASAISFLLAVVSYFIVEDDHTNTYRLRFLIIFFSFLLYPFLFYLFSYIIRLDFRKLIKFLLSKIKIFLFIGGLAIFSISMEFLEVFINSPSLERLMTFRNVFPQLLLGILLIFLLGAIQSITKCLNINKTKNNQEGVLIFCCCSFELIIMYLILFSLYESLFISLAFIAGIVLSGIPLWKLSQKKWSILWSSQKMSSDIKTMLIVILIIFSGIYPLQRTYEKLNKKMFLQSLNYLFGRESLVKIIHPPFNYDLCIEIANSVPEPASIFALNSNLGISHCTFSPLIPRGKILHHYQSILAPHFELLALGSAREAYDVFKNHDINYFYIGKNNIDFWGAGWSEGFDQANLEENFTVFYEDNDFYILTWRGEEGKGISKDDASYINKIREEGRLMSPCCYNPPKFPTMGGWFGFVRFSEWAHNGK